MRTGERSRVCVLVVTRQRPKMLEALLAGLRAVRLPYDCEATLIVVDNDARGSARPAFDRCARDTAWQTRYVHEPRLGIPLARNRALDEAAASGAHLAAFVDDDEVPDADWLGELVRTQRQRSLHLVGGPVRPVAWRAGPAPGAWQRLILYGVQWRYRRGERRAQRRVDAGSDDGIAVVTNNWLIDLAWWREQGPRFDETLRISGGSDALFFAEAKRIGARSGWCPSAVVEESMPPERLTFTAQVRRARSQANASFHRKYAERSPAVIARALVSCAAKSLAGVVLLLTAPAWPGPAIVGAARAFGWTLGRTDALRGRASTYYLTVDGR